MACNICYNYSCNGGCKSSDITRQIRIENNSIGRDGESAYEIYVREGGTLTEEEWLASLKGDGVQIKGSVNNYSDLLTLNPTPILGDSWIVNSDGLMYVYGETGFPAEGLGIKVQGDSYIPINSNNYFDI